MMSADFDAKYPQQFQNEQQSMMMKHHGSLTKSDRYTAMNNSLPMNQRMTDQQQQSREKQYIISSDNKNNNEG